MGDLLTIKNISTFEHYTGEFLDFKPSCIFVFYKHDNGYRIRQIAFDDLYNTVKEIGGEKVIAVSRAGLFSFKQQFVDKYIQEHASDEDVKTSKIYLEISKDVLHGIL